jgi:hypothetical protein
MLFLSGFQIQILHAVVISPMHFTFITRNINRKKFQIKYSYFKSRLDRRPAILSSFVVHSDNWSLFLSLLRRCVVFSLR